MIAYFHIYLLEMKSSSQSAAVPFSQLCRVLRWDCVDQKRDIGDPTSFEAIHNPLISSLAVPKIISCHHQLHLGLRHLLLGLLMKDKNTRLDIDQYSFFMTNTDCFYIKQNFIFYFCFLTITITKGSLDCTTEYESKHFINNNNNNNKYW